MKVLRLLVYEGPEEWVLDTLSRNEVQDRYCIDSDKSITSIIFGKLPDEIDLLVKRRGES